MKVALQLKSVNPCFWNEREKLERPGRGGGQKFTSFEAGLGLGRTANSKICASQQEKVPTFLPSFPSPRFNRKTFFRLPIAIAHPWANQKYILPRLGSWVVAWVVAFEFPLPSSTS